MYDAPEPSKYESVKPIPATRAAAVDEIFSSLTLHEARYLAAGGDQTIRAAHVKLAWLQDGSPLRAAMFGDPSISAAAIVSDVATRVLAEPPPDVAA